MQTGIRLIGNGQAPVQKYWKHLLELIQEQKINPLDMVTHVVQLTDMPQLYKLFDQRTTGMQKVFVRTRHSFPPSLEAPSLIDLSNVE